MKELNKPMITYIGYIFNRKFIVIAYPILISIGHFGMIFRTPKSQLLWLRLIEIFSIYLIALFAYRKIKIFSWLIVGHMVFTSLNTLMEGIFRPDYSINLKIAYTIFGAYFLIGSMIIAIKTFRISHHH